MGQLQSKAIKTRAIFDDRLGFPLYVIKRGEEGSEGIGDHVMTAMLHQGGKYFKTTTMVEAALVLK